MGYNPNGLGDGPTTSSPYPILVPLTGELSGKSVVRFSMSFNTLLFMTNDGKLYSWGRGTYDALGDGTTTSKMAPVPIVMDAFVGRTIAIKKAGVRHNLRTTGNTLLTWGRNAAGSLSTTSSSDQTVPVQMNMGAIAGHPFMTLGTASDSSFALVCGQAVDDCGVCGGDSSCAPPPCNYDVCGVCNGDGTSCDINPPAPISTDVQLNHDIAESGTVDIDNPIFTMTTTGSKTDSVTTTFSYTCISSEARNRI